jgi:hypothetical protein
MLADNGVVTSRDARQRNLWGDADLSLGTESSLIAAALSLSMGCGVSPSEADLKLWKAGGKPNFVSDVFLSALAAQIAQGADPLGDAFCTIRSAELRRESGATYTPKRIIDAMAEWASSQGVPARVVDPGCGSAKFLAAASRIFPDAMLVGIETDPLAALIARANLAAAGLAERARIILKDYRTFDERESGRTLYIGNPPYVRHHKIEPRWKNWLFSESARLGHSASKLAGLHVYFMLATAVHARRGDVGAFITAAEWLDVNYGSLVRNLLLTDLGGKSITVIEPTAQPFPDVATTAAIVTFEIGSRTPSFSFKRIAQLSELKDLDRGRRINRDRLASSSRWSYLSRSGQKPAEGYVELGEICRVHRGQVTGANGIWIAGEHSEGLPDSVLYPTVTRAREVIAAAGVLDDSTALRCVIDIPVELDSLSLDERKAVQAFLIRARRMGAHHGYVATHRKAWWAVGLRSPAPIISTYMARRAPAFVLNKAGARHINVAHGLYPRVSMDESTKSALVSFLQVNVSQRSGRTYAGGLTKFEPREMERVIVPGPELLALGVNS